VPSSHGRINFLLATRVFGEAQRLSRIGLKTDDRDFRRPGLKLFNPFTEYYP
jgi:hypothetical protein